MHTKILLAALRRYGMVNMGWYTGILSLSAAVFQHLQILIIFARWKHADKHRLRALATADENSLVRCVFRSFCSLLSSPTSSSTSWSVYCRFGFPWYRLSPILPTNNTLTVSFQAHAGITESYSPYVQSSVMWYNFSNATLAIHSHRISSSSYLLAQEKSTRSSANAEIARVIPHSCRKSDFLPVSGLHFCCWQYPMGIAPVYSWLR